MTCRIKTFPIAYRFADEAARLAVSGTVPLDIGRFGWQLDDDSIWMLTDDDPTTWTKIGGPIVRYERHIQIDAKADGTVANQPAQVDFFTVGGLQFASVGAKYSFCQWEIPDDWDGTDIYIEIDWFPDSGAISGTDAIRWTIEYRSIAEGELINNGTSVTVDNGVGGDTSDYSQYQTKHTRFTLDFDNANQPMVAQDHMYFKVTRDTAVANDFAGTVTIMAYEIIYYSIGLPTSN